MGKAFYSICVALLYALLPLEGSVNAERIRDVHANYLPYGENAVEFFCKPSGRFSDGRLITDFISELANLPLISPYLQPHADLSYGANLGSVAAGIVVEIYRGKVLFNHGARKFLFMSLKDIGCLPGFSDGLNVCCGTGPFWGLTTCGGTYGAKIYHLCRNVKLKVPVIKAYKLSLLKRATTN
ncbi:uncharacterized protein LOC18433681 [Amborella trichopoda]|uniref:uncharacterized protein LOC18433681 n=1 Tax=Amborella trichopoda TaxID=13333 RepID=UPI0009BCD6E8|nr:uncharacterized protein LOC18433681 [Amborella trichopoda]|eukprot:XP_020522578.1 uncharacterized protein LOC18433681 [Amborella trichopoda]